MKKKLYVSITAAVLVMACAVVSFATFSDMVTVQYVSGYNGGRQLGVPTMKKLSDSRTAQFYAANMTSWVKPETCLALYDRAGTTASAMVKLKEKTYIPANATSEKGSSYNVKIYGSSFQVGSDSMKYMYDAQ